MQSINNDILDKNLKDNPNQQLDSSKPHWQSSSDHLPFSYRNYFDYFYDFFAVKNLPKEDPVYINKLYKQLKKSITKQLAFNPSLLSVKHYYHTFKKPHTWSLKKWRRDLRKYLRNFFANNSHLQYHKLLIFREFHQCFIKCHQITVWNKKSKDWETFHKKNNFCSCQDSAGNPYHHLCKKTIHKVMITSIDLDFSTWAPSNSNSNYYYFKEIVDPNKLCIYGQGDQEIVIIHPITKEPVDEMTLTLSYANKDAEGRFKDPELYRRHHDNPKDYYFDIFDYEKDLALREKRKVYRQKTKSIDSNENKKTNYLSKDKEYVSYFNQIKYLTRVIAKSCGEKKKKLIEKRALLILEFNAYKNKIS